MDAKAIKRLDVQNIDDMMEVMVYVDGACKGNPGPGGWAFAVFAVLHEQETTRYLVHEQAGGNKDTTNNVMELEAAIQALDYIHRHQLTDVTVVTDSEYVFNGITRWVKNWRMKGWKTSKREDVKNKELWDRLDRVNDKIAKLQHVNWAWSKGHSSNQWNNYVDKLASDAAWAARGGGV